MNWIDYATLGVVALSALISLMRGFTREALSLLMWVLSFWVAAHFATKLAGMFAADVPVTAVRVAVAFVLLFVITLILGALLSRLIVALIRKTPLSPLDRTAGMLFGTVRGVLLTVVMVMVVDMTPLQRDPHWQGSILVPKVRAAVTWGQGWLPKEWADHYLTLWKTAA